MDQNQDTDLSVRIKDLRENWIYSTSFTGLDVTLPGDKMRTWFKERGMNDNSILMLTGRPLPPIGVMEPIEYIEQDVEKYFFIDIEHVEE